MKILVSRIKVVLWELCLLEIVSAGRIEVGKVGGEKKGWLRCVV